MKGWWISKVTTRPTCTCPYKRNSRRGGSSLHLPLLGCQQRKRQNSSCATTNTAKKTLPDQEVSLLVGSHVGHRQSILLLYSNCFQSKLIMPFAVFVVFWTSFFDTRGREREREQCLKERRSPACSQSDLVTTSFFFFFLSSSSFFRVYYHQLFL